MQWGGINGTPGGSGEDFYYWMIRKAQVAVLSQIYLHITTISLVFHYTLSSSNFSFHYSSASTW